MGLVVRVLQNQVWDWDNMLLLGKGGHCGLELA